MGNHIHTNKAPAIRALKRRYPDLSNTEIARKVDCDESNVRSVLRRFGYTLPVETLRKFQDNKADVYDALQHRLLESITDDKLSKMQPYPAVVATGILEDKARTIRGQATGINATLIVDLVELLRTSH
jgi:hypothetical protein